MGRSASLLGALAVLALVPAVASAQGVVRAEATLEDLVRVLGDVVAIEVAVPAGATVVRVAIGIGEERAESVSTMDEHVSAAGPAVMRIVLRPVRSAGDAACPGETMHAFITEPDTSTLRVAYCVPVVEGSGGLLDEAVIESVPVALGEWTPVYVRGWDAIPEGGGKPLGIDMETVFTVQVYFGTEEHTEPATSERWDAERLSGLPELATWLRR